MRLIGCWLKLLKRYKDIRKIFYKQIKCILFFIFNYYNSCYARSFKLTRFKLSLLEFFSCPLSLFFLDEKSNQKNQVLCINSKVFAKNYVGAKKTHRLRQTQTIFRFIRLHFCKNLNLYKAHPKRIDLE